MTRSSAKSLQRGFTLLEALVALVVMAFGMLALASMQMSLSRNADVAKQRTEATRLAQRRIEEMRSFTTIAVVGGQISWDGLAGGSTTTTTNATYKVTTALSGAIADAMRPVSVTVRWLDRTGQDSVNDGTGFFYNQEVMLASVIAKGDPVDIGYLGNPLPLNTPLKRPKNRNINIPIPALDLGGGQSSTQFDANYAIVYSNVTAGVVYICDPNQANATAAQINALLGTSACSQVNGYIIAGYIGRTSTSVPWPSGINHDSIVRDSADLSYGIKCLYSEATDQNTNAVITADNGYKYYICVVPLIGNLQYDGTLRLGGMNTTSNYIVCRYQYTQTDIDVNERNIQPYVDVNKSMDEQNYLLTSHNGGNCPSTMNVSGVSTGVLHQDCRVANVLNHGTVCPAASP